MDDDEYGSPPLIAGRSIDIEINQQEVISVDLDALDSNPEELLELLLDARAKVSIWSKFILEYWRRGWLDAAESVCERGIEFFNEADSSSVPFVYALHANIQLTRSRMAPKIIMNNARRDDMRKEKNKDSYNSAAARSLNAADKSGLSSDFARFKQMLMLTRGMYQLSVTNLDDAQRSFDAVLAEKKTNIVALIGKARIAFARKQFPVALKLYQQVLTLSPQSLPDPRIGIGLCFWAMDQKAKAKECWERSLEVHPNKNWIAQLLLGLEAINSSKNPQHSEDDRTASYVVGTKHIEQAFNGNQRNAAAANALCDFFVRKGDLKRALKLAERTIQFADILTLLASGHIHLGCIAQAEGSTGEAILHFNAALKSLPKNALAAIGLAQMQFKNDEVAAAIHTLDTLVNPPNPQRPIEAIVLLACLRAFPRPGVTSADAALERQKARDLYDQVIKTIEGINADEYTQRKAILSFGDDVDMFVEIARLWQDENTMKMRKALQEAVRASQESGASDPRLLNNMAVMMHLEGNFDGARTMYEHALTNSATKNSSISEGLSTTTLYNLARVYEDQGDSEMAKEAYDKLLTRHSEYVDAKIRQAQLLVNLNRNNDAHDLLKQALSSQKNNLNVRAFYTHFLIHSNLIKPAKEFVFITLKDFDNHDIYSLCAAGWIQYHQSRESRDVSSKGQEERKRGFQRSAEFYEKALQLDPQCAFAAQGLAIVTAEDFLSPPSTSGSEDAARRTMNARDALEVFGKVRESMNDASVYINMGHAHYARDEFDRAIEAYESASKRYEGGPNVAIVLYLCRSWYAKANRDQSYAEIRTALKYAQQALHLQPTDKAILYNIAMVEQKAAEMLFTVPPAKRSLRDLQRAIDQGIHATKLFASLAADRSQGLPYSKDMADQRRKYGESMLRKGDEHVATQRQYEEEAERRMMSARQKRQEDKERQLALEREREEELRRQAQILAEERRKAREEAIAWTQAAMLESDEEKEKRPRRGKKQRSENVSDEETPAEPKRKKKSKKREGENDAEEEALFSGEEGEERLAKKRSQKKRVVRDDEDEDAATSAPRKKQFKSKEVIEDSDEEMS